MCNLLNLMQISKDFIIFYIYSYIYIHLYIQEKSNIFTTVFKTIKIFKLEFPSVMKSWF